MPLRRTDVALLALVVLVACPPLPPNPDDGGVDAGAGDMGEALPVLFRPFTQEAPTETFFDHDAPRGSADSRMQSVSYWGEAIASRSGADGYEFQVPLGTVLRAAVGGLVVHAGPDGSTACPRLEVIVSNAGLAVAHRGLGSPEVRVGQTVTAGQRLGVVAIDSCSMRPSFGFAVFEQHDAGSRVPRDPFGWFGRGEDPWARDGGAVSTNLWAPNEAPVLYREVMADAGAWLKTERIRWLGVLDELQPNNEFIDIVYNVGAPNIPANVQLSNYRIANVAGDSVALPAMQLNSVNLRVRLYVGSGSAGPNTGHLNRVGPLFNNAGDCLRLIRLGDTAYSVPLGRDDCPDPTCLTGLKAGSACCSHGCGVCGGDGCELRGGGAAHCCPAEILDSGVACSGAEPPCVLR